MEKDFFFDLHNLLKIKNHVGRIRFITVFFFFFNPLRVSMGSITGYIGLQIKRWKENTTLLLYIFFKGKKIGNKHPMTIILVLFSFFFDPSRKWNLLIFTLLIIKRQVIIYIGCSSSNLTSEYTLFSTLFLCLKLRFIYILFP